MYSFFDSCNLIIISDLMEDKLECISVTKERIVELIVELIVLDKLVDNFFNISMNIWFIETISKLVFVL
jgi:hypothetical protein